MVILSNPRAGHGSGGRRVEALRRVIERRGLDCTVVLTERPGHATELARREVAAGHRRFAVMGGDGTIGEVVNAIVGADIELGVIAMGTGNDVARTLGLPINNLEAGLEIALTGASRPVDVGRERDRHFISVMGLGFPSVVAAATNAMTWLKGSPAFFVAVYKGLHRLRAIPMRITLDDRTIELDAVAVLIQNTPYTGGGLHMAPKATVDDGVLDVVVVERIGRLDLMLNFPKTYWGRHFDHPSFAVYRSRTVRIETDEVLPKMFDGDLCGSTPVEASVVPGGVRLVVARAAG